MFSALSASARIQDIVNGDIAELAAEHMILVLLNDRDVLAHDIQHAYVLAVKDLALQQAQDLDPVLALDEVREQRKELVIKADEFVPDFHTAAQRALVGLEGLFADVAR